MNQRLQETLNANEVGLKRAGTSYRIGDKVMQIRNNYEKSVFNGDIGRISKVNTDDNEIIVSFYERAVSYDILELDELVLAYATTIHKSQGSEFPYVVRFNNFKNFLRTLKFEVVPVNDEIALKAAEIRSNYPFFKQMDVLQLATACVLGANVFYTSDKQLLQFEELAIIRPILVPHG